MNPRRGMNQFNRRENPYTDALEKAEIEDRIIHCPKCGQQHIDRDHWYEKRHTTHLCEHCQHEFKVKNTPTRGVEHIEDLDSHATAAHMQRDYLAGMGFDFYPYDANIPEAGGQIALPPGTSAIGFKNDTYTRDRLRKLVSGHTAGNMQTLAGIRKSIYRQRNKKKGD